MFRDQFDKAFVTVITAVILELALDLQQSGSTWKILNLANSLLKGPVLYSFIDIYVPLPVGQPPEERPLQLINQKNSIELQIAAHLALC